MTGSFMHPFARPTGKFIPVIRGEGAVVWDADGTRYLDAMASLWYCAIGHGRKEMADAIAAQVSTLEGYSCFDPFTNPMADAFADHSITFCPPLITTDQQIDEIIDALAASAAE